ncbi:MAG: TonB-dependent receptor, partial [Deltaproteobacteria bacterium]|nr:TonB-dependent receptor [Deltaproteobacteria bacterium]
MFTALAVFLAPDCLWAEEPVVVPPIRVEDSTIQDNAIEDSILFDDEDFGSTSRNVQDDPSDIDGPEGPVRQAAMAPAVRLRQSGGVGQPAGLVIRGVDPQGTMTTLDGVPLNSPFLGGSDLSGLSLMPLVRLRVSRGGMSAGMGSDAIGGVLEAITGSPLDLPGAQGSITVGSFGTAKLKVQYGQRSGNWGGMAAVGFLSSSGDYPFTDTNGNSRVRSHNSALALEGLIKIENKPAEGHRLTLMVEGFADDRDVPGLEQFPSDTAAQKDQRAIAGLTYHGPSVFTRGGSILGRLYFR